MPEAPLGLALEEARPDLAAGVAPAHTPAGRWNVEHLDALGMIRDHRVDTALRTAGALLSMSARICSAPSLMVPRSFRCPSPCREERSGIGVTPSPASGVGAGRVLSYTRRTAPQGEKARPGKAGVPPHGIRGKPGTDRTAFHTSDLGAETPGSSPSDRCRRQRTPPSGLLRVRPGPGLADYEKNLRPRTLVERVVAISNPLTFFRVCIPASALRATARPFPAVWPDG